MSNIDRYAIGCPAVCVPKAPRMDICPVPDMPTSNRIGTGACGNISHRFRSRGWRANCNLAEHHDGEHNLQLTTERVSATFFTTLSSVQHWAREVAAPLFAITPDLRPSFPNSCYAEEKPANVDGSTDLCQLEIRRRHQWQAMLCHWRRQQI